MEFIFNIYNLDCKYVQIGVYHEQSPGGYVHTYEKKIVGSEEMVQKFNVLYFTYTRFD